MGAEIELLSLRGGRNRWLALAIGALMLAIGFSLPRLLDRHTAHKVANEQLVELQAAIVSAQGKIRLVQGQIAEVQAQLSGAPSR